MINNKYGIKLQQYFNLGWTIVILDIFIGVTLIYHQIRQVNISNLILICLIGILVILSVGFIIYSISLWSLKMLKEESITNNNMKEILNNKKLNVNTETNELIINNMSEVYNKIITLSSDYSKIMNGITKISSEISSGSKDIEGSTIAIVEVAQKLGLVFEEVQKVNSESIRTKELCTETAGAMDKLLVKNKQVIDVWNNIKAENDLLNDKSNEISKIVSIIKNISSRINILSLNAAIEAARAGETGNGFAVVAVEIRKLADKTKEATLTIDNMVKAVQMEAKKKAKMMEDTLPIFYQQDSMVITAGKAFTDVVNKMEEVLNSIEQVNSSLGDINECKDKATISISMIAASGMQNSMNTEELLSECKSVNEQIFDLKKYF